MKILLIGEYSNVHATLADGLRQLGHKVTVASNGDFWKNYPRDISLTRKPGKLGGAVLLLKLYSLLPSFRGYDVVQLINPMFVELKAEKLFHIYRYLRKNNKKVFLGGFGMDWYWVNTCIEQRPLRYSDFNIGETIRTNQDSIKEQHDWIGTAKEKLNKFIANDCDRIITGLYEYWICYSAAFPHKTSYIPLPIKMPDNINAHENGKRLKIFIGINKSRNEYKGTDIMLKAAQDIQSRFPDKMELIKAESVPFMEYEKLMDGCDAILDQLYSYTPSMNSLLAMSKGIICIGGGENEGYELIKENDLRPIINVKPNYESVYKELKDLVCNPIRVKQLKLQSVQYVMKHHDYIKVAKEYEQIYENS